MVDFNNRLQEIRASAAPSMVPAPREEYAPPPKAEEVIPDISTIITDRKARLDLARLVERHGEIGKELGPLKKERDALTTKIKKLAGTFGVGKALCGGWRINYFDVPRTVTDEKVLMQSLLEQGVQPSVVQKAFTAAKATKPSYTLKITAEGEEDEE